MALDRRSKYWERSDQNPRNIQMHRTNLIDSASKTYGHAYERKPRATFFFKERVTTNSLSLLMKAQRSSNTGNILFNLSRNIAALQVERVVARITTACSTCLSTNVSVAS